MNKCIKCGSYAFNLYKEGIDQGGLCDVHYWQGRAQRAEALAEQPAQQEPFGYFKAEPFGWCDCAETDEGAVALYESPSAQRTWVGLTDEERNHARHTVTYSQLAMTAGEWAEAVQIETEKRLKEKNT